MDIAERFNFSEIVDSIKQHAYACKDITSLSGLSSKFSDAAQNISASVTPLSARALTSNILRWQSDTAQSTMSLMDTIKSFVDYNELASYCEHYSITDSPYSQEVIDEIKALKEISGQDFVTTFWDAVFHLHGGDFFNVAWHSPASGISPYVINTDFQVSHSLGFPVWGHLDFFVSDDPNNIALKGLLTYGLYTRDENGNEKIIVEIRANFIDTDYTYETFPSSDYKWSDSCYFSDVCFRIINESGAVDDVRHLDVDSILVDAPEMASVFSVSDLYDSVTTTNLNLDLLRTIDSAASTVGDISVNKIYRILERYPGSPLVTTIKDRIATLDTLSSTCCFSLIGSLLQSGAPDAGSSDDFWKPKATPGFITDIFACVSNVVFSLVTEVLPYIILAFSRVAGFICIAASTVIKLIKQATDNTEAKVSVRDGCLTPTWNLFIDVPNPSLGSNYIWTTWKSLFPVETVNQVYEEGAAYVTFKTLQVSQMRNGVINPFSTPLLHGCGFIIYLAAEDSAYIQFTIGCNALDYTSLSSLENAISSYIIGDFAGDPQDYHLIKESEVEQTANYQNWVVEHLPAVPADLTAVESLTDAQLRASVVANIASFLYTITDAAGWEGTRIPGTADKYFHSNNETDTYYIGWLSQSNKCLDKVSFDSMLTTWLSQTQSYTNFALDVNQTILLAARAFGAATIFHRLIYGSQGVPSWEQIREFLLSSSFKTTLSAFINYPAIAQTPVASLKRMESRIMTSSAFDAYSSVGEWPSVSRRAMLTAITAVALATAVTTVTVLKIRSSLRRFAVSNLAMKEQIFNDAKERFLEDPSAANAKALGKANRKLTRAWSLADKFGVSMYNGFATGSSLPSGDNGSDQNRTDGFINGLFSTSYSSQSDEAIISLSQILKLISG